MEAIADSKDVAALEIAWMPSVAISAGVVEVGALLASRAGTKVPDGNATSRSGHRLKPGVRPVPPFDHG
ncbi:unnamed protein product [Zymoseptoria tritici ST99CH_1A5]|uniref:Uncharacterized protein n=1 Tax=Zymoseptoria tritici ST99CH_1A5 TaxID=1276529 RepID=A0A1Y6LGE6_ZYMTR|nr:unnamed protein product [Zymoseptoria tritici ST99CH_1A5]